MAGASLAMMRPKMNDDFIDALIDDLEGTAHWRREKATEYPHDNRNDEAAVELEHLAKAVRDDPKSAALTSLRSLDKELALRAGTDKSFDFSALIIECSDYRRRIGFSEFPSIGEYLATLAAMYGARLRHREKRPSTLEADEIRRLRATAADLRSKVSQGSYGDPELQLFWSLAQSAGLTLMISNPELSMRAGLGDGFFMSLSRDRRRPKLVNFLKAMTSIVEVADERLAALERANPSLNRSAPRSEGRQVPRMEKEHDDLLTLARVLSQMAVDEIRNLDDERPNDDI
jgi:hypothetical protein